MASRYSTNEVLQLVLEDPVDESESENDLDGYVSDDNLSVISQQHDYEDDRVYRRDGNDSTIEYTGEMEMILIILMMMMILKLKMKMLMKMMCKCQMNFCHCQNFLGFLVAQRL